VLFGWVSDQLFFSIALTYKRNDFLPNIPSLRIREGALDLLLHLVNNSYFVNLLTCQYKKMMFQSPQYITNDGEVII
jgi:5'-3' exonuclease